MELKDFVRDTLNALIDGVREVQGTAAEKGKFVVPDAGRGVRADSKPHSGITVLNTGDLITFVEFDVALTASDSKQTKGGIGVLFGAVNLGSQGQSDSGTASLSRIKFQIPLVLPVQWRKPS